MTILSSLPQLGKSPIIEPSSDTQPANSLPPDPLSLRDGACHARQHPLDEASPHQAALRTLLSRP